MICMLATCMMNTREAALLSQGKQSCTEPLLGHGCACAVYCGTATQAVHMQVTGSSCNVTVFDMNALYTAVTNPTLPCERSIYNKTCTVFAGSLLIDISPAIDPQTGNFYKQHNPSVQARAFPLLQKP